MKRSPIVEAVDAVALVLESHGWDWAFIGGVALSAWGAVRATGDVDVIIVPNVSSELVTDAFLKSSFIQRIAPLPMGDTILLSLLYQPPDTFLEVRIDLFVARSPFADNLLKRRIALRLWNKEYHVVSAEDLLLMKILAGRIIDLGDARGLIKMRQGVLDVPYLQEWAHRLGVGDAVEKLLTDVPLREEP